LNSRLEELSRDRLDDKKTREAIYELNGIIDKNKNLRSGSGFIRKRIVLGSKTDNNRDVSEQPVSNNNELLFFNAHGPHSRHQHHQNLTQDARKQASPIILVKKETYDGKENKYKIVKQHKPLKLSKSILFSF